MSDRELLELAAKAAGLLPLPEGKEIDIAKDGGLAFCGAGEYITWNPLTDDGDALRLSTKLGLAVHYWPDYTPPHVLVRFKIVGNIEGTWIQPYGDDDSRAVRLAIVNAAAQIEKGRKRNGNV